MGNGWDRLSRLANLVQVGDLLPTSPKEWVRWALVAVAIPVTKWVLSKTSALDPAILWVGAALVVMAVVWTVLGVRLLLARGPVVSNGRPMRDHASEPPETVDRLSRVGTASDARAIYRIGAKIVEFDSWAAEYFDTRDATEIAKIERTVRASQKTQYNDYDLQQIVAGKVPQNESVWVKATGGALGMQRRVKFWTRSALTALSEEERRSTLAWDVELSAWLRGRSWSESLKLLGDGYAAIGPHIEPRPAYPLELGGLAIPEKARSLADSMMNVRPSFDTDYSVTTWWQQLKSHLALPLP
jgi:hypothetical protein